jgi:hypothetical protein
LVWLNALRMSCVRPNNVRPNKQSSLTVSIINHAATLQAFNSRTRCCMGR